MNKYRRIIEHFAKRPILLNIILDGYGIGRRDHSDAVSQAKTPVMDRLMNRYAHTRLWTHGHFVGLPDANDMGGSEVGHLTIGAGTVLDNGSKLIGKMIRDGSLFRQPALVEAVNRAKHHALHLLGLLSDGNIHSHIDHWEALIKYAFEAGVTRCYFHVLLDGRDVGIQSADQYIERLEGFVANLTSDKTDFDYRIVSGGGREFMTMDRSLNWDKVKIGWDAHVHGSSLHRFTSALEAVHHFRRESPGIIDQDIPSFVISDESGHTHSIKDNDVVICTNFRGDRAIEITRAFVQNEFKAFDTGGRPDVFFCGMTVYDQDTGTPANHLVQMPPVANPFGKRVLEMGCRQFRLAETQKFPHVTFFFNGGYRLPLDPKKETYHMIPSDVIESFSQKPAMKAAEIAHQAVTFIRSGTYDYGLINFANADMVGHTGDFAAVVAAVEAVDQALGKLIDEIEKINGVAVITADHGNADEMLILNPKTGVQEVSTKHSLNPVPYVVCDPLFNNEYALRENTAANPLGLASIAATNFILMGKEAPDDLNRFLFDV